MLLGISYKKKCKTLTINDCGITLKLLIYIVYFVCYKRFLTILNNGAFSIRVFTVYKVYNSNKLSLTNERNFLIALQMIFIFPGIRNYDLMILAFLKCWHRMLF